MSQSRTDAGPVERPFFGALETLRGIAALAVAVYHIPWTHALYEAGVIRNAYLMVDFFFVLSGFVLCHSYGHKLSGARELAKYVWLRFGRLYPLHVVVIVAFLGLDVVEWLRELATGDVGASSAFSDVRLTELGATALLIQGLGMFDELRYNFPSWSISTEFYVCVAFGALLYVNRGRASLGSIASAISIAGFIALLWVGERSLTDVYTYGALRCVQGFFLGVATYRIYQWRKRTAKRAETRGGELASVAILLLAVAFLSVKRPGPSDFFLPPVAALVVLLVASQQTGLVSRLLNIRPLAWIGKVSYSVYMVHAGVIAGMSYVLQRFVGGALVVSQPVASDAPEAATLAVPTLVGTAFTVATVALILAISWFTFCFIEDPCRKKAKQIGAQALIFSPNR